MLSQVITYKYIIGYHLITSYNAFALALALAREITLR